MSSDKTSDPELRAAMELRSAGRLEDALQIFRAHASREPVSAAVMGMLSTTLYELDRFDEAAEAFLRTLERSPRSTVASLGRFHSLEKLHRRREALEEVHRYLRENGGDEYDDLLAELEVPKGSACLQELEELIQACD